MVMHKFSGVLAKCGRIREFVAAICKTSQFFEAIASVGTPCCDVLVIGSYFFNVLNFKLKMLFQM